MFDYHQDTPPTELKSVVLGRESSRKKKSIIMSSASGKTAKIHKPLPKGWWERK